MMGSGPPVEGSDLATLRRALAGPGRPPARIPERGCYIYGAGGFGRRIARELRRLNQEVLGFIDRTGRERPSVDGLPCCHPDDLDAVAGTAYVHGMMNHAASPHPVLAWAETRGFTALCFPADLYGIPGFGIENYWLTPAQETRHHLDAIETVHDSLEDAESRAILRQLLAYRVSTDPRDHPAVDQAGTYVPDFLPLRDRPLTFVDGGAYTGDSLEVLLRQGVTVADWIAFEPDSGNMAVLRATARRHRPSVGSYTLIRAGLSDTNGVVRFVSGDGAASRITAADGRESTTEIDVVRLDDVIQRSGAIYVKLDVEGGEIAALHGMAELLSRRPTLAISLYHRPADLWEIPRVVGTLYDNPRLRLRQHGHYGFDTVLYVMPD